MVDCREGWDRVEREAAKSPLVSLYQTCRKRVLGNHREWWWSLSEASLAVSTYLSHRQAEKHQGCPAPLCPMLGLLTSLSFPCCRSGWELDAPQGLAVKPWACVKYSSRVFNSYIFTWIPNSGYFQNRLWLKAVINHLDNEIWKLGKI